MTTIAQLTNYRFRAIQNIFLALPEDEEKPHHFEMDATQVRARFTKAQANDLLEGKTIIWSTRPEDDERWAVQLCEAHGFNDLKAALDDG